MWSRSKFWGNTNSGVPENRDIHEVAAVRTEDARDHESTRIVDSLNLGS